MVRVRFACVLVVAGCAGVAPTVDESDDGKADSPTGISKVKGNPLAGKPLSGQVPQVIFAKDDDPGAVRDGRYTWGPDLKNAPSVDYAVAGGPALSSFRAQPWAAGLPSWDAGGGLKGAFSSLAQTEHSYIATDATANDVGSYLNDVKQLLPNDANPQLTVKKSGWVRAFSPVYGRFQAEAVTPPASPGQPSTVHDFADPMAFGEARYRAAKSYCAMRQAAFEMNGQKRVMGEWSAFDLLWWHFAYVSPSLRLGRPQKVIAPASAEAFAMPIVVGTKLDAARGPLLPSLGELTHPLVWIAGDGEALSQEDPGTITQLTDSGIRSVAGYLHTYRDLAHVDALAGLETDGTLKVGPMAVVNIADVIDVKFTGQLDVRVGHLEPTSQPYAIGAGFAPSQNAGAWPPPRNAFLDFNALPSQWASDAPLAGASWLQPSENGALQDLWTAPATPAIATRLYTDDDRALVTTDDTHLTATLTADGGVDLGFASANVHAQGGMSVNAAAQLVFREQVSDVDGAMTRPASSFKPLLQTNVTMQPVVSGNIHIDPLVIHIHIKIDLLFGSITIDHDLFRFRGADLLSLNGNGHVPEAQRFRAGEFSEQKLSVWNGWDQLPSTFSHLPSTNGQVEPYASFTGTVGQCVGSTAQPPAPSPPDAPRPGDPEPRLSFCAVALGNVPGHVVPDAEFAPLPADICAPATLASYVADFACVNSANCDARRACVHDALTLACGGKHLVQQWEGRTAVAHDLAGKELRGYGQLVTRCTDAFADSLPPAERASFAQAFAEDWLELRLCDGSGAIQGEP